MRLYDHRATLFARARRFDVLHKWRSLDVLGQKLRGLLDRLPSALLEVSGHMFWNIEQKPSVPYKKNVFLLYMCCTA
jgi:hypothetical protein